MGGDSTGRGAPPGRVPADADATSAAELQPYAPVRLASRGPCVRACVARFRRREGQLSGPGQQTDRGPVCGCVLVSTVEPRPRGNAHPSPPGGQRPTRFLSLRLAATRQHALTLMPGAGASQAKGRRRRRHIPLAARPTVWSPLPSGMPRAAIRTRRSDQRHFPPCLNDWLHSGPHWAAIWRIRVNTRRGYQ